MTVFVMYMNITVYHYYSMYDVEQVVMTVFVMYMNMFMYITNTVITTVRHHACCNNDILDCNVHVHHKQSIIITAGRVSNRSL
jgi:hypothetical protein